MGTGNTSLYVNGVAQFAGIITTNNLYVAGIVTATNYDLSGGVGRINAGIITASTIVIGSGGTSLITTTTSQIGIGTASPRAKVDIEGSIRFKAYYEAVERPSIVSTVVTIDLSKAQTFDLTVDSIVNNFIIINCPPDSSSFTIKITQNSTGGYFVDINDFQTSGGVPIPIYWSGGGVLPIPTNIANRTDIYSFKTFDGGSTWYGFVGGQNFL